MTDQMHDRVDRLLHDAEHADSGAEFARRMVVIQPDNDAHRAAAHDLTAKRDRLLAEALALDPQRTAPACILGRIDRYREMHRRTARMDCYQGSAERLPPPLRGITEDEEAGMRAAIAALSAQEPAPARPPDGWPTLGTEPKDGAWLPTSPDPEAPHARNA